MKLTATEKSLKVAYKLAGKLYNTESQETGNPVPFEETTIAPGETFDLPAGAELIHARELGGTPEDTKAYGDSA